MYVQKPKITFVFRSDQSKKLKLANLGKLPKDYFYYYHALEKYFLLSPISLGENLPLKAFSYLNNFLMRLFLKFDYPILPLLAIARSLKNSHVFYATTPKIGIGIGFLKKIKIINFPVSMNILGIYDQLHTFRKDALVIRIISNCIKKIDNFISVSSMHEARMFSRFFNVPRKKIHFLPYCGVDIEYFKRKKKFYNFILSVGVDPSRDWETCRKVALAMPYERFFWATDPQHIKKPLPLNVEVRLLSENELKEHFYTAKIVLILTKLNHHLSGLGSAMRSMSCGKPTIFTTTPGIKEYEFKHGRDCFFVKPHDSQNVVRYISLLSKNSTLYQKVSNNAGKIIRQKHSYKLLSKRYVHFFANFVKGKQTAT